MEEEEGEDWKLLDLVLPEMLGTYTSVWEYSKNLERKLSGKKGLDCSLSVRTTEMWAGGS